jgi:hypothetical protein
MVDGITGLGMSILVGSINDYSTHECDLARGRVRLLTPKRKGRSDTKDPAYKTGQITFSSLEEASFTSSL